MTIETPDYTLHPAHDGEPPTATWWSALEQRLKRGVPSDREFATMNDEERDSIVAHCKALSATTIRAVAVDCRDLPDDELLVGLEESLREWSRWDWTPAGFVTEATSHLRRIRADIAYYEGQTRVVAVARSAISRRRVERGLAEAQRDEARLVPLLDRLRRVGVV